MKDDKDENPLKHPAYYNESVNCAFCKGTGEVEGRDLQFGKMVKCDYCKGTGKRDY